MAFTYRPMLKTKAGEAVALGHLATHHQSRIFPIFQVGENPPPTFGKRMAENWAGRGAALDGLYNFNLSGSTAAFDGLFSDLVAAGILVVPSIEISSPAAYLQAAASKIGMVAPGLVLRTNLGALAGAAALVASHGWTAGDVDLVVEVGHIAEFNPATFSGYISTTLNSQIPPSYWRSVTLSGSSAPKDFGGLPSGINIVPRQEWRLWNAISHPIGQPIDYSDYGVAHLDLSEPPAFAMARATVSVRYTAADYWIMIKGRATTGPNGIDMGSQYRAHAQALVARSEFNGVNPCWADTRIAAIANGSSSSGSRAQWVEIHTNRHLAFVAENLP